MNQQITPQRLGRMLGKLDDIIVELAAFSSSTINGPYVKRLEAMSKQVESVRDVGKNVINELNAERTLQQ